MERKGNGRLFDNMLRRSVAFDHILRLRAHSLLSDEELTQFSLELQGLVNQLLCEDEDLFS